MNETWKDILGTTYGISSIGRVYNSATDTMLKPFPNNNGYLMVDIFHNTVKERVAIHRLVARYFIPNPEAKDFVNHIDGNKQNNKVDNLEWVTPSENSQHAVATGLSPVGSEKTLAKLTEADVIDIQKAFDNLCSDFFILFPP